MSSSRKTIIILGIFIISGIITSILLSHLKQQKIAETDKFYKQAKQELTDDWYPLYRIVERIARANNLDQKNWQISTIPSYKINPFQTEVNLIPLYHGILNHLAGDSSAIACVVVHQIEYYLEKAVALTPMAIAEKKSIETSELLKQEIISIKQNPLDSSSKDSEIPIFKVNENALKLMTQAGFDPQSCLRVINVLKNIPNTKIDTTHSSMLKQIDRLNELITTQNRDYLVLQGKKNLSKTEPLNYNLAEDRTSLKLNYTPKKNTSNDTAIFTIFF